MFELPRLWGDPGRALTELDVGAGLAAPVGVQDQQANFEEKAVGAHIEATGLVEAVAAHHQRDEAYSFTQHLDVMNYPIDSCLQGGVKSHVIKLEMHVHASIKMTFKVSFDTTDRSVLRNNKQLVSQTLHEPLQSSKVIA